MPPGPLFAKYDIHRVIDSHKARMVEEYKRLSDDIALDEAVIKDLKARYLLNIPTLRPPEEMWAEEGKTRIDARRLPNRIYFDTSKPIMEEVPEYIVHIPFDGDPRAFDIAPSAYNSRIAVGEVVGQEVLLRAVVAIPGFDVQADIDGQLSQVNWALRCLRENMPYFDQQLEIVIRQAVQARKRTLETRASSSVNLKIPIRQAPSASSIAATPPPVSAPIQKVGVTKEGATVSTPEKWDVFISHAWEDKPYVQQLAASLIAAGITVWLDTLVVRWGDSLLDAVNSGLKGSNFVIVVLSPAFLKKKQWTEYELSSAFSLEADGKKRILPILHGIAIDDLLQYNPGLAIRLAQDSKKHSNPDIANELLILLDRRPANAMPVPSNEPAPALAVPAGDGQKGETVAYTWYWTNDGKIAGLYVRKVDGKDGIFMLEEPNGTIREGTADEVAAAYAAARVRLRNDGLRPSSVMGSSQYPQFNVSP